MPFEITLNVNLTIRDERALNALVTRIESKLDAIAAMEKQQMTAIEDLEAAVARETTVTNSAITLLQQLSAQITAAGTDPVALKAITDNLNVNTDALAAAVSANTPAAATAAA